MYSVACMLCAVCGGGGSVLEGIVYDSGDA